MHAGQGDLRRTFRPVIPPLHRAGSERCSVARLTRCPPHYRPRNPTLRRDPASDSVLGVGRPSTRLRRPLPGAPHPHPPSPAIGLQADATPPRCPLRTLPPFTSPPPLHAPKPMALLVSTTLSLWSIVCMVSFVLCTKLPVVSMAHIFLAIYFIILCWVQEHL
uniref:Uncharacterized protein n=1 Tax=Physcomitrium patens TaxID=3218 RepID=A0A2K1IBQ9_PHYPA|nr:hypothetical protein PHYPA_031290 [Physcomitrium patens]PNR26718.1 hypothetical protein PHYPA_030199 [Physcomitrium patens]